MMSINYGRHGAAVLLITCVLQTSAPDTTSVALVISGPSSVVLGDAIIIVPKIINNSNTQIKSMWGDPYTILLRDQFGNLLKPKAECCMGSRGEAGIAPGGNLTDPPINLITLYDLSVPGIYRVRFTRLLDSFEAKSPMLGSNELTISVIPKQGGKQ